MIRRRQASWIRWRQRRIDRLRCEGVEIDLARRIAKAEMTTRQRLGRSIGWKAARAAQLIMLPAGDGVRFALTGPFAGLTAERRERLLNMQHVSPVIGSDSLAGFRFP